MESRVQAVLEFRRKRGWLDARPDELAAVSLCQVVRPQLAGRVPSRPVPDADVIL